MRDEPNEPSKVRWILVVIAVVIVATVVIVLIAQKYGPEVSSEFGMRAPRGVIAA